MMMNWVWVSSVTIPQEFGIWTVGKFDEAIGKKLEIVLPPFGCSRVGKLLECLGWSCYHHRPMFRRALIPIDVEAENLIRIN